MSRLNNSYALLIGVGDDLPFTVADANAIKEVLIDKKIAGYPPENVICLTNEKANRQGILSAFDTLEKKINKDSRVLLYYSGHGSVTTLREKERYYLQPNGYIHTLKDIENTWVSAEEIKERINRLVTERLIFFFDCCHAQGLTKGGGLVGTAAKMDTVRQEGLVQDVDDEEGMAIISACRDEQLSIRWDDEPNSLFTKHLLKVLRGEHQSEFEDPYIRIIDVIEYLLAEIPKEAKQFEEEQNPFVNIQFDNNFELSIAPKEKIKKRSASAPNAGLLKAKKRKKIKKVFREIPNANNAIIFVHGFSGEAWKSFGKIPDFLADDDAMDGWDMFPFGFSENVDPKNGKEVFASVKDIDRIADNLSAAIKHKFGKYKRIAIVGYSLGGLSVQRAILNLSDQHRERLSHVILLGTPSNGISNNAIKKLWKNKIKALIQDAPFIKDLRQDWSKAFKKGYPFEFKVAHATQDDYVTKDSSLDPFPKKYWVNIGGDHFSLANATTKENDSYELILKTLTDSPFFNIYTNEEEINIALGEYDEVVRKLKPALEYLDERGLEKLVYAMECSGERDEAIEILQTHKVAQNDADMLNVLGSLFKNEYLNNSKIEDGKAAFNCYTKALKIAKKTHQSDEIYLNAINLAFLNLMLEADKKDMQSFANEALEATKKVRLNDLWKLATIAEANLYLNKLDVAKEFYKKAAKKASIRDKIVIHTQAYTAYVALHGDDPKAPFVTFLKNTFLT